MIMSVTLAETFLFGKLEEAFQLFLRHTHDH
jgi:hypothetical protein